MKKIFCSVLALNFMFLGFSAKAEEKENLDQEESLTVISTKGSTIDIVQDFKSTTGELFSDPKAPRFLLYDQKRDVAFGVGGSLAIRGMYDFGGSPTSGTTGFIPYTIPVPGNNLTRNRFAMSASNTSLFFKILGNNAKIGQFQAYIGGNFTGANNAFILQDAYVKFLGLTIGRTWSTFNDLAVVPPTVDAQGPNGAAEMRTEQIRFSSNLTKNLSFGIAAELQQTTGRFGEPIHDLEMSQRIPDIPAYLQYGFGANQASHVRIAGVLRNMNYKNELKDKTEYATGYGVQLSSKINVCPFLTLYGQMTYGEGIAQYINDLSGNGLSLVAYNDNDGKMKAVEAMGWFAHAQFNITKNLYATVGYSQAKVFDNKEKLALSENAYRYGQYAVGNVFYNLTSDLQVGVEYIYGNRVDISGEKAGANRFDALVQFNF